MPLFRKDTFSNYVYADCRRQVMLALHARSRERRALGMPEPMHVSPWLVLMRAGVKHQGEMMAALERTFGPDRVKGNWREWAASGGRFYRHSGLAEHLFDVAPGDFVVECEYRAMETFRRAVGAFAYDAERGLEYGAFRPDVIQVSAPGTFPDEVLPDGRVSRLSPGDGRLQLRVMDVKLTAEPNLSEFSEVVLYSMVLSGWLADAGLADRYCVSSAAAVWPGSTTPEGLRALAGRLDPGRIAPPGRAVAALESDLKVVPFDAFSGKVLRFFGEVVPSVLCRRWDELDAHVNARCARCPYLGGFFGGEREEDRDERRCADQARAEGRLDLVPNLTRGERDALRGEGIVDVADLGSREPEDKAFDAHLGLRRMRQIVPHRARALATQSSGIAEGAGASAMLPRGSDLQVFAYVYLDQGSARTLSFSVDARLSRSAYGDAGPPAGGAYRASATFLADERTDESEERALLGFLRAIREACDEAVRVKPAATLQVYVWDEMQFEHLMAVVGRHLDAVLADGQIRSIAWFFPPEDVLRDADLSGRETPVTVVREVVSSVLAVPVPHFYDLLEVATRYGGRRRFAVNPMCREPFSDQLPRERLHGIWDRSVRLDPDGKPWKTDWRRVKELARESAQIRIAAMEAVVWRLQEDLGDRLVRWAPRVSSRPSSIPPEMSVDGRLWSQFVLLDEALDYVDSRRFRAKPANEREACFRAARLTRRIVGDEYGKLLSKWKMEDVTGRRAYALRRESAEVKFRESDIGIVISPESDPAMPFRRFKDVAGERVAISSPGYRNVGSAMEEFLGVVIRILDREGLTVILDPDPWDPTMLDRLEAAGVVDLSSGAVLDSKPIAHMGRKVKRVLADVGNPEIASENRMVRRALLDAPAESQRTLGCGPLAEFLWAGSSMAAAPSGRDPGSVRDAVLRTVPLNDSQARAWDAASSRRLAVIWGPPGTGKSRTLEAVLFGALAEALFSGAPARVLLSASTYDAVDNVLYEVERHLESEGLLGQVTIARLRSETARGVRRGSRAVDVAIRAKDGKAALARVKGPLCRRTGVTLVAAPPGQVHAMLTTAAGELPCGSAQELFDLIVIDEASQMDVAGAVLVVASLASGGSVVLAGDHLQLSPIQKATAPKGLEAMVGSVYGFCHVRHGVEPMMLEDNYRANETLVSFSRTAGYLGSLRSVSPRLRMGLSSPLPTDRPADWPRRLPWSPAWASLLSPDRPAACFVYPDGRSGQHNGFEVDAVGALLMALKGRLGPPEGEVDPRTGLERPSSGTPYGTAEFWARGVGVVTPHRAQQGAIASLLQRLFPAAPRQAVRDAVDTVERFQGQQRDVIVASFTLGDPDVIRLEDEFLMSLTRFNVMASRARTKIVVLVSEEVVDHLSADYGVLTESNFLKRYALSFCGSSEEMVLPARDRAAGVRGVLRYR